MFRVLLILCPGLLLGEVHAQQDSPQDFRGELQRAINSGVHYSLSRQFVIHSQPHTGWLPALGSGTNLNIVRLEPNLLAVSCERIKQALIKELGCRTDDWHGRIRLDLFPARTLNETIQVTSTLYGDGWAYTMCLPDAIEEPHFVAAMVEILLIEMANRNGTGHCAEIPAWLTQGMTQQLMMNSDIDLVLQPPSRMEFGVNISRKERSERKNNPLSRAHDELSRLTPLTLEELSWPTENQFTGAALDSYRSSAQLFMCELERLKDGQTDLRAFLAGLNQHLNWQIALLEAFHDQFSTQRDLEKWWDLHVSGFTGRDLAQMWSLDESWQKLDEIIRPPVQVRTAATEMPMHTAVTLQTVIQEWDFARQNTILGDKLQQLNLLRVRVAQDLIPLVDGYRLTLYRYLKNRNKGNVARLANQFSTPALDKITWESISELDGLDARREELRPKSDTPKPRKQDTASINVNR